MEPISFPFDDRLITVPISSLSDDLKDYLELSFFPLPEKVSNMVVVLDLLKTSFYKGMYRVSPTEILMYGTEDLKGTLDQLVNCFNGSVKTVWRDINSIQLEVENTYGYDPPSCYCISFLRFRTINDILKSYDWISPKAAYDHVNLYYRPYAWYIFDLLETNTIYQSAYVAYPLVPKLIHIRVGPNDVGCAWCPINVRNEDSDNAEYHKMLRKVANGKTHKMIIRDPDVWDATSLNSYYDYTFDSEIKPGLVGKLKDVAKRPMYKTLFDTVLPFEFRELKPFHDFLCKDCLTLYKPIWDLGNLKWYKDEIISLYLVLQKHGLILEVAITIQGFIELLKVKDKMEARP